MSLAMIVRNRDKLIEFNFHLLKLCSSFMCSTGVSTYHDGIQWFECVKQVTGF
jgi:hypothetical protein